MTQHSDSNTEQSRGEHRVALSGPAEIADALPYLMGFYPDDSIVLVALHGSRGRIGGRIRLGIPEDPRDWPEVSTQLAADLASTGGRGAGTPDGALVFLVQDPSASGTGREVRDRLQPLAERLRTACGTLGMPVLEALCISDGRYWSYCCPDSRCCPEEGSAMTLPGTSAMAAAAVWAGVHVQGSLKELESRLEPLGPPTAVGQERALDTAGMALVPRMLGEADREAVRADVLGLANRVLERFMAAPPVDAEPFAPPVGHRREGRSLWKRRVAREDSRDDELLSEQEAATLIVGLQDRATRDQAAEWMEGACAPAALRLWRALSRRCVGAYSDYAAAPLALTGWVAWSLGDEAGGRVALGRALRTDPGYLFARLLHQACNEGLDPEPLRRCLREERAQRSGRGTTAAQT